MLLEDCRLKLEEANKENENLMALLEEKQLAASLLENISVEPIETRIVIFTNYEKLYQFLEQSENDWNIYAMSRTGELQRSAQIKKFYKMVQQYNPVIIAISGKEIIEEKQVCNEQHREFHQ